MKNFEAGRSVPTANNLASMQRALEYAGIEFIHEEQGGPGILVRRLRLRAYIPGDGLHIEAKYTDLILDAPDNDFDLPFRLSDSTLAALAGRQIVDEADAKAVVRTNDAKLLVIIKERLARDGLSSPGGRPLEITPDDVHAISRTLNRY